MKKILESLFRKRKERSIEWMQAHLDELTENEIKDMIEVGLCDNLLIENIEKLNDAFPPLGKIMEMLNDTSEIKDKVRMLKCLIPMLKTNIEIAKRTGRLPDVEDVFSRNIIVYESMLDTYNVLLSQQIQDESNIPLLDVASKKGGFTTSQQVLFFIIYLMKSVSILIIVIKHNGYGLFIHR